VHLDFALQFELGDPAQIFTQDFFFDFELMLVAGVLVVASAAAAEVLTVWFNPMWRRLEDGLRLSASEAGLLFGEGGFNFLSGENQRDEHGFTASVLVTWRTGGEAGETVAAVDEFFNI
jgi:hypothetical protein